MKRVGWLILEGLAVLALLFMWFLSPVVNPWLRRRARANAGAPVLLVHGFGMSRGSMLAMGLRLARAGHGPIVAVGYSWLRPIDRAARRVAEAARELARAAGVDRVDVVAHSLGGLVSRKARELSPSVGRIVTLGTPHRGAWVGRLPIGPMARPMRPDSFGDGEAREGDLAIASRLDLVIPWSRATLDPPARSHVLDHAGHGAMLFDGGAARVVGEHLSAQTA